MTELAFQHFCDVTSFLLYSMTLPKKFALKNLSAILALIFDFLTCYFQFFSPNSPLFLNTFFCLHTEYYSHTYWVHQKRNNLFSPLPVQNLGNKNRSLVTANRIHQYSFPFPPHRNPVYFSPIILFYLFNIAFAKQN